MVAILVWVFAIEVLPNLHLGVHARLPAHDHERASSVRVLVHYGPNAHAHHDRGGHRHEHAHPPAPNDASSPITRDLVAPLRDAAEQEARRSAGVELALTGAADTSAPDSTPHGAHALAHRGVAITTPPPVTTQPLPVLRLVTWRVDAVIALVEAAIAPDLRARGPPSAA